MTLALQQDAGWNTKERIMKKENLTAVEALDRLKKGNERYLCAETNPADTSPAIRRLTCERGQNPYAIIITCSDSRVIPENIFTAGIGELFVIRVAGNVMDPYQLGSVEYAAEHLGCQLVVVMGHDHCGAVHSALHDEPEGYVKFITDEIRGMIGSEKDDLLACCLNAKGSARKIREKLRFTGKDGIEVRSAIYHIEDGRVEFLD